MMSFFMDGSALAKRYVTETGTALVDFLFNNVPADRMVVLNLGFAEVVSVLENVLEELEVMVNYVETELEGITTIDSLVEKKRYFRIIIDVLKVTEHPNVLCSSIS